MLSITDSLFTKDKDNELFYFVVFTKSMNGSDGFYSEAVGLSCYNFITQKTDRFVKHFLTQSKLDENDFKNWANYIYGEIHISREKHEQEAVIELEKLLKERIKDSKTESKELIDNLISEIKTTHNRVARPEPNGSGLGSHTTVRTRASSQLAQMTLSHFV